MAANGRYGVLLVDDVAELRTLLRLSLELSGRFTILGEAENGVQGVELAGQHQPDLVLLDISMPLQDGLESLPMIRSASPRSKIVMLSGFEERRLGSTALGLGASAYLEKGLPPERIVDELLDVMGGTVSP
jgi:DNA-binding NarL/FixJ family response regulator